MHPRSLLSRPTVGRLRRFLPPLLSAPVRTRRSSVLLAALLVAVLLAAAVLAPTEAAISAALDRWREDQTQAVAAQPETGR